MYFLVAESQITNADLLSPWQRETDRHASPFISPAWLVLVHGSSHPDCAFHLFTASKSVDLSTNFMQLRNVDQPILRLGNGEMLGRVSTFRTYGIWLGESEQVRDYYHSLHSSFSAFWFVSFLARFWFALRKKRKAQSFIFTSRHYLEQLSQRRRKKRTL